MRVNGVPSWGLLPLCVCIQWLSDCCDRVKELGVFGDKTPNHVLVNEYTPGQGIMVCIVV